MLGGSSPAGGQEGAIGASVTVSGLQVTLFAPDQVRAGRPFLALALVSHAGPNVLEGAWVRLGYDHAGVRSLGPASRRLGTVHPHGWRWAIWVLKAEAPGQYVVVARVEARDRVTGELLFAESPATVIRVR